MNPTRLLLPVAAGLLCLLPRLAFAGDPPGPKLAAVLDALDKAANCPSCGRHKLLERAAEISFGGQISKTPQDFESRLAERIAALGPGDTDKVSFLVAALEYYKVGLGAGRVVEVTLEALARMGTKAASAAPSIARVRDVCDCSQFESLAENASGSLCDAASAALRALAAETRFTPSRGVRSGIGFSNDGKFAVRDDECWPRVYELTEGPLETWRAYAGDLSHFADDFRSPERSAPSTPPKVHLVQEPLTGDLFLAVGDDAARKLVLAPAGGAECTATIGPVAVSPRSDYAVFILNGRCVSDVTTRTFVGVHLGKGSSSP